MGGGIAKRWTGGRGGGKLEGSRNGNLYKVNRAIVLVSIQNVLTTIDRSQAQATLFWLEIHSLMFALNSSPFSLPS